MPDTIILRSLNPILKVILLSRALFLPDPRGPEFLYSYDNAFILDISIYSIYMYITFMHSETIYLLLTREFNQGKLRCILSSGQAAVLHRIAMMSKDGDWIIHEDPESVEFIVSVLDRYGARYRFGAPLDERWLKGGGVRISSSIMIIYACEQISFHGLRALRLKN